MAHIVLQSRQILLLRAVIDIEASAIDDVAAGLTVVITTVRI